MSKQGVNFTNILRAPLCTKVNCVASVLTGGACNIFRPKEIGKKGDRKMLVKLTLSLLTHVCTIVEDIFSRKMVIPGHDVPNIYALARIFMKATKKENEIMTSECTRGTG